MPIQPICRSNCQGLCVECGQNLNEGSCTCSNDQIDSRFAKLQNLLNLPPE
jgi:uncharacterized protein